MCRFLRVHLWTFKRSELHASVLQAWVGGEASGRTPSCTWQEDTPQPPGCSCSVHASPPPRGCPLISKRRNGADAQMVLIRALFVQLSVGSLILCETFSKRMKRPREGGTRGMLAEAGPLLSQAFHWPLPLQPSPPPSPGPSHPQSSSLEPSLCPQLLPLSQLLPRGCTMHNGRTHCG